VERPPAVEKTSAMMEYLEEKGENVVNVCWTYLDKSAAAVKALRDYPKMRQIIDNTEAEIRQAEEDMAGVSSPRLDGMPGKANPQAGEDRMIRGIEEIDVLRERYRRALEYMDWFLPAWNALSEDDRFVLEAFYGDENEYGTGAAEVVESRFAIERSSAYRRKNRALDHLTTMLYGRW